MTYVEGSYKSIEQILAEAAEKAASFACDLYIPEPVVVEQKKVAVVAA